MNPKISNRRSFLNTRKSQGHRITIGFAGVADFRSFIGQEYIAGIIKAASDYDINLINMAGATKYSLFNDIDFTKHYLKNFSFMKAPLVDGMVTWASSLCDFMDSEKSVLELFESLKPLPMVDIGYMDIPGVTSIRIDNETSMRTIIDHLIHVHNYKKFVFIGSKYSSPHLSRMQVFKEELEKNQIEVDEKMIFMAESMDSDAVYSCVEKMAEIYNIAEHEIDAIVTSSDIIASSVIEALDNIGFAVPNDICVTGFNNQYVALTSRSPITTVDLEYFKRGYSAVEILIDRIMEPEAPVENFRVPTKLVIRQSCGCFEKSILDIDDSESRKTIISNLLTDTDSESELRSNMLKQLNVFFINETENEKTALVDAIFEDIYEKTSPAKILRWFQKMLQNNRKKNISPSMDYQIIINRLRCLIYPIVKDNNEQFHHMEDIFHSLRILVSVFNEYDTLSQREGSYLFNNLSHIAILFASATTGKQIRDALRYQLGEMDIPGIILCLSENMSSTLESAKLELIHPEPENFDNDLKNLRISAPHLISKKIFPNKRRYTYMLETLYYGDNYFGYMFLEMGSQNVAMYDAVKTMLSNALYSIYTKEGRTVSKGLLISKEQVSQILNMEEPKNDDDINQGLTIVKITEYLLNHINEMTNLDQMSEDLGFSKSYLVRQAKLLTGFTIQSLHEKIKIEQAKSLLQKTDLKLNEIATRLGFQNQNYFSNVFKKCTGVSPSAWGKRN